MNKEKGLSLVILLVLALCGMAPGQSAKKSGGSAVLPKQEMSATGLDAEAEKRALGVFLNRVERNIESAGEAMPADKYAFAPTDGEFRDVRTFGQQLKHLAATNEMLAAAALNEEPPADAGDEEGPEAVRTKAEILEYVRRSFADLGKAVAEIGDRQLPVQSSPISPLQGKAATRIALIVEALMHANDHYGQMVVYLRMNGVVPPASRPSGTGGRSR